jgi:hypothetical protein
MRGGGSGAALAVECYLDPRSLQRRRAAQPCSFGFLLKKIRTEVRTLGFWDTLPDDESPDARASTRRAATLSVGLARAARA